MVSNPPAGFQRVLHRTVRIIIRVIIILFALIIVILILLQTSFVQNIGRKKIEAYLQTKLHSRVEIGGLSVAFPKKIVLKDLYFEDLHHDTLLAAGKLNLDVNLWGLLNHKIIVNQIELEKWTINITRIRPDSDFNYAFITKAFSSNTPSNPSPKDTLSSWQFELGKIHLASIRGHFKDDATGNDDTFFLSDLQTSISRFDLNRMDFSIPDFRLNGLLASFRQYRAMDDPDPVQDSTNNSSKPISLKLERINLGKVALNYLSEISGMKAFFGFGELSVMMNSMDLQRSTFDVRELGLKESVAKLELARQKNMSKKDQSSAKKTNDPPVRPNSSTWNIRLGKVDLTNNQIQFDDNSSMPAKSGVDYHHMAILGLNLDMEALDISDTHYRGHISKFGFREKSGFILKRLNTSFSYDDHGASLGNFILQTNNSLVQHQSWAKYTSASSLSKAPGNIITSISFVKSTIAINDLLLLVPSLEPGLKNLRNTNIRLSGKIDGRVKDLRLSDIEISGLHNTAIQLSGSIKGLPSGKDAIYEIQLKNLVTGSADIHALVPPQELPEKNIRIPENLTLKGKFQGTINDFITNLNLRSAWGEATVEGHMNIPSKKYNTKLDLSAFDLGKWLRQDTLLGRVSLHLTVKGQGFDYKTMETDAHVQMPEGIIKGYSYGNLLLDLSLHHGSALIKSTIDDENVRWDLNASGNIATKYPSLKLELDLDTLNLHNLHLLKDTVGAKFKLNADFANTNPDSLQGRANISGIALNYAHQLFQTDSVIFIAEHTDSAQIIVLHSETADLDWRGKYKITEVSEALKQAINHYYAFRGYHPVKIDPQNWKLNVLLKPSSLLMAYDPMFRGSDTARLEFVFNSHTQDLQMAITAPSIRYGRQFMRNLSIRVNSVDTALQYSVNFGSAYWSGLKLFRSSIVGNIANNKVQNSVMLDDSRNKLRYRISTNLQKSGAGWKIFLIPDSLILNYNNWNVAADNFILYDSTGLQVNDLKLGYENESFLVRSKEPNTKSPIEISFENFRIKTISAFANQDSLAFGGVLNGNAELRDIFGKPLFTTDLTINDFIYSGDSVGNISLQVKNKDANTVSGKLNLMGHGNDVSVDGQYSAATGLMDLNLKMNRLNLDLIKAASADQVRDIRGNLKGEIKASGKPASPVLDGWLQFDSAYIIPAISGEKLKLPPDKIEFDEDGVNFSNYTLIDSAGNKATIDGNIYTKDFKSYRFDLSLQAQNFRLINSPRSPNNLYYGRLILDADVDMLGDLQAPTLNAILTVNPKTDFTMTLPSDDPEIVERQGVVVFVDKAHPRDTVRLAKLLDSLSKHAALKGMDVSATIETDSNALFTLIIDERNGDALSLRGRADLTGGIDPSGKMSLTGNYELENGAYNLSLSILKRKFNIVRGSTITWSGDPREATVDIRATYLINTPPIDLMQNQLASSSTEETTRYKQKLPFIVTLIMKGDLLTPIISFEISLQSDKISQWPDVDLKLQQIKNDQSEINKQVFALLLLNRFVQENPFVSQTPTYDAETIARQSVSKILSDQVNQLAASLVKGVDLTVDLNSDKDYSSGTPINQTQLNVGVSKNLFSERVRVTVGSNFQLGEVNPNQDVSNIAGDVDVDYKLTKDGRYMLRAYRRDQYQSIVEGQVVETGLSFILTFDYNAFYELFSTKKKEQKKIQHPSHKKPKGNNSE